MRNILAIMALEPLNKETLIYRIAEEILKDPKQSYIGVFSSGLVIPADDETTPRSYISYSVQIEATEMSLQYNNLNVRISRIDNITGRPVKHCFGMRLDVAIIQFPEIFDAALVIKNEDTYPIYLNVPRYLAGLMVTERHEGRTRIKLGAVSDDTWIIPKKPSPEVQAIADFVRDGNPIADEA